MTVVIVGAGNGGLTLALSLHQVDVAARIYGSGETLGAQGVR
jgi:2-polyprenyl-6-methoxyphenol hydroxylase-like FAD-dependent oxidoreductase